MKRSILVPLFVCTALGLLTLAATAATVLPFPVKVGGKAAVLAKDSDVVAVIADPVAADAELEAGVASNIPMVIINAFPSDATGTVKDGASPFIILAQNTNKVKISATMEGKPLAPGYYVLNIVAANDTARVLLQVK